MTLADSIQNDGKGLFIETDDFAESVTYHPHRHHGQSARDDRTITIQVFRNEITGFTADGGETSLPVWEIHVANDSVLGISSDELDLGGDAITFPPRVGKTPVKKSITRLLQHDAGMLILECR